MARTNKEKLNAIEIKIEKEKTRVENARLKYEAELERLELLMSKRDAIQSDELLEAISRSDKSFEEVMEFLGSGKKRGRKKGINQTAGRWPAENRH